MTARTDLSDQELLARIGRITWFHSLELRPGLVTPGAKSLAVLRREEEALLGPFDLTGRSVLDIGAWNGAFTFAAKRRGAGRVLATDEFAWTHPVYRGREAFDLARAELGLEVETLQIDPTRMDESLGQFDLVLFLGVFYHLFDPIDVLQRMRAVTRQVLLVETHQDALERAEPAMVFYPGRTLANDDTNWWGPNPPLMLHLLRQLGFARIYYRDHPHYLPAEGSRTRGIFAAILPGAEPAMSANFGMEWRDLGAEGAMRDFRP
ncbi:class I SAM-dependent methyltransferase [Sediminicoccus rosea]|jgi:tRNA (mo5U34)-methyltransferase|uniref:Class I SAM-dependent methyltransferase n=1 Tax=Sediminicoccus rosea TaxID=1225128 RepID=A0ABZ0PLU5_9PROT|nr:class I SAM-dependent methyltransferase [Sediminicoccus rosea]WPB86065.1 class I SAM-dependent methyltransferase [Sediminicoccus rosea]